MSDPYNQGDPYVRPASDNPFGITKDMVERISTQFAEARRKNKLAGKRTTEATWAIFKIPPYDWTLDPKGYCKNIPEPHELPPDRCTHCGYRFVHIRPWDAFCGPCHIAMLVGGEDYLLGWQGKDKIRSKIRIPDGVDESVFRKTLKDGSSVEFKTGVQAAT